MALGNAWRLLVYNRDTGITLDFSTAGDDATVTYQTYSVDTSNGTLSWSAESTASLSTDTANGSYNTITSSTGSTAFGMVGSFEVTTDGSPSGNVDLLIEYSTDGGTTYPSDAGGFDPDKDAQLIATVNLDAAETVRTNFQVG